MAKELICVQYSQPLLMLKTQSGYERVYRRHKHVYLSYSSVIAISYSYRAHSTMLINIIIIIIINNYYCTYFRLMLNKPLSLVITKSELFH